MRVGLIGVGAIGSHILEGIRRGEAGGAEVVGVADVPAAEARLIEAAREAGCAYRTDPLALLELRPDLVVEAASQAAVRAHAIPLLEGGVDLLLMSVGALADTAFLERLSGAARAAGRRVYAPSGAIGGLDTLRSAGVERLDEVLLTTSKPPRALAGAPFFERNPIDLAAIRERTVIFEGTAAEAVGQFPANINVAAAVSLAGIGPERTRVRVVADPALSQNVHEVEARGAFGEMRIRLANLPSPANPKSSLLAALSPLAMLRRLTDPIQVG
jgi:aspartate dehydrogenase